MDKMNDALKSLRSPCNRVVLTLNEAFTIPKPVEAKKEHKGIGIFTEMGITEGDGKESKENVRRVREIRKTVSFLRRARRIGRWFQSELFLQRKTGETS